MVATNVTITIIDCFGQMELVGMTTIEDWRRQSKSMFKDIQVM